MGARTDRDTLDCSPSFLEVFLEADQGYLENVVVSRCQPIPDLLKRALFGADSFTKLKGCIRGEAFCSRKSPSCVQRGAEALVRLSQTDTGIFCLEMELADLDPEGHSFTYG